MLFSTHKSAGLASIHIKQWDIATGPSQQNFSLCDKKGKTLGRCSFNAAVRQETLLVVRPAQLTVTLGAEKKGNYSLSVKCVTEDSQETMVLPVSDTREWAYIEGEEDAPALTFPATIETLRNASMQAKLWRHKKTGEQVLSAETWLSFSHMFKQENYTMIKRDGPGYRSFSSKRGSEIDIDEVTGKMKTYTVTKRFTEKLTLCGNEVGEISGTMVLADIPLISQLISGVNTENGFLPQSSNFLENTMKTPKQNQRPTMPAEVQQISSITETLNAMFASGDTREGSLFSARSSDIREHINKVKDLCTLLRTSKKQSMVSFIYESKGDMLQAQGCFLDTGEHFLRYADIAPYAVRPFYYEGLIHVLRRGELDLGALALTEEDEKLKQKRIPNGIRYRTFLRGLLLSALGKMKLKGVDKKIQQYTEFVCAVCYFRVPEYRKVFLRSIREKPIETVSDWTYEENHEFEEIQTHILPMFDWQNLFYHFLPANAEEDSLLTEVLNDSVWKKRVAKRGIAYFRLLTEWATHVRRLFLDKNIPWLEIPGYSILIATFLSELKTRSMFEYTNVLGQCACSLLYNPHLLTLFVRILYQKTNVYSVEVTMEAFEMLNKWFMQLWDSNKGLPITFDEGFFIEGQRISLGNDIGTNVAKTLWFLYRNYHVLSPRTKEDLIGGILLGSLSYSLSLHWSQVVRQMYWSILFYRIISFKFLPFDFPAGPADEEAYVKALDYANRFLTGPLVAAPMPLQVYQSQSRAELLVVKENYEKWLERVQLDLSSSLSKTSNYGGLGVFPYPELTVDNILLDRSESAIQEEW